MRIALIQQHASRDRADNLRRALDAMSRAAGEGARIAIFAELAVDRFFPQHPSMPEAESLAEGIPGPIADAIAARAAELDLVTVFNMYEVDESGRYFDSSPVFNSDGALLGVTRMVHITDYACFHETAYYHPGDHGAPVFETAAGKIGVAICYDRHYPEYMRALGLGGAELVVIPQAGAVGEWPEGMYEAEVRTAAFQNGYFVALCNRVGKEDALDFAGQSFVTDPEGRILGRAGMGSDELLLVEIDLAECATSTARTLFYRDRRPDLYADWLEPGNQASR